MNQYNGQEDIEKTIDIKVKYSEDARHIGKQTNLGYEAFVVTH